MFSKLLTKKYTSSSSDNIERLAELIDNADAIVIGAGSGLSTAAGFTYAGERFNRYFSDFSSLYGFNDMYTGGFYPYKTLEEYWTYWSRFIWINRYQSIPNSCYDILLDIVREKDYFVITTNVDHCFQKEGFDKHRLFYTQGDYGLFQCLKPCCQETYDNENDVRKMLEAQNFKIESDNTLILPETLISVPDEFVPRCPHCGSPMTMNLRCDNTFVQDEGWYLAAERYENFLRTRRGEKILFLELGVGYNTPVFCSSSTRDNSTNIRLKQQISGFSFNKQKDLEKGGMRNVWQKNVKSRKHAGLYQQAA